MKIPAHILNITGIGLSEKVLLAHFYSFGAKGCWQSNETPAEIFMVSPSTISKWVKKIKIFVNIKNAKGYYRTIWAKTHPDVQLAKNGEVAGKSSKPELAKSSFRLSKNLLTTNNNTIKENYKRTIASSAPLPAGGQAPATLIERRKEAQQLAALRAIESLSRSAC